MKLPNPTHRQLLETLRGQLIPWANNAAPFVLLSSPPRVLGTNVVSEHLGKALPLKHGIGMDMRFRFWPDQNMNSSSVPYFGCVVEGEADLVVGTTTAMCRKMKIPGTRWITQMPTGSFFLFPPGVPFGSGRAVHWKRPHPEKAYSRIFWMHVLESGANCHFSTSSKGKLWSHPDFFIPGNQLFPVVQSIIHEMQDEPPQYVSVLYYQLGLLLNYTLRNLLTISKRSALKESVSTRPYFSRHDSAGDLVQRAIAYIDENLRDTELTVEKIAAQFHLSTMHLNRLFQQELHISVKAFVIQQRMETGRNLLVQSSLTIGQIYFHCGYVYPGSFIKAFIRHFGVSPTQYRLSHKTNVIRG